MLEKLEKLFSILGIDEKASVADIKKAYRKKARKHHPDTGGKREDFDKITEAYVVLSDPIKKLHYQHTGKVKDTNPEANMIFDKCAQLLKESLTKTPMEKWKVRNIQKLMVSLAKDAQKKMKAKLKENADTINTIEDLHGRFDKTSGGTNIFKKILSHDIEALHYQKIQITDEINLQEKVITTLEEYSFRHDSEEIQIRIPGEIYITLNG